MAATAAYYECPSCGFFHSQGSVNPCADHGQQFEPERLDELHPKGWVQVRLEKPNLARLQALTPTTDLYGNTLTIGCPARIAAFAFYDTETDDLKGIAGDDRTYMDGTLTAIGEIDGVQKYTIQIERATDIRQGRSQTHKYSSRFEVSVNGSPSGLGWPMFSVSRAI